MWSLNGELATALIFSLKTFGAALLGLFIAFWLVLDEPYWVPLTVFVVAQPDSGLVLAKGFFRLLGTAAGVLITVTLVFAFAQYGELFITFLAVWIGLCCFAARAVRNFATYSFQLAGYTVAIVGIPTALNLHAAYPIILARPTEISLGIRCMALVSRLICPRELAPKLIALAMSCCAAWTALHAPQWILRRLGCTRRSNSRPWSGGVLRLRGGVKPGHFWS